MARVSRAPEERRMEFIATAAALFREKGFEKTSVEDIVKAAGVAKGTFYYYFASKEQVLEALIENLSKQSVELIGPIIVDEDLSAIEKFNRALTKLRNYIEENGKFVDALHGLSDEIYHYKSLAAFSMDLAPEMARIIEQGIHEGIFQCANPLELSETILLASNFLLDEVLFPAPPERKLTRLLVIQKLLESGLHVPPGTFDFFIPKRDCYEY